MHRARVVVIALCLAVGPVGCHDCDGGSDPCELDLLGCEDDLDVFAIDPSCGLEGDLEVVLGDGDGAFMALGDGESPEVHWGMQGGQHIFGAVRVLNPDLERYDMLRVTFGVSWGSLDAGSRTHELQWESLGSRTVVLGAKQPLVAGPDGAVEETGILVVLDWWPEGEVRAIDLLVEDPCGRTGTAHHVVPAEAM